MKRKNSTPVIVTIAPTGAELTPEITPHVPLRFDEIVSEAEKISQMGASIIHIHARDKNLKPTCDPKIISKLVKMIQQRTSLIVQVSTGGDVHDSFEQRCAMIVRGVEMASLTLGSINFGNAVFLNPVPLIQKLIARMKKMSVKPELEIFDVGMLEYGLYLIGKKELPSFSHFDFVLGGRGFLQATEKNLDFLISKLPQDATFSVAGIGPSQFSLAAMSLERGGHVRIGLEDNIYLEKGKLAQGNVDLLQKLLKIILKSGRRVASVEEARKILHLPVL